jgi:hypothetical protein
MEEPGEAKGARKRQEDGARVRVGARKGQEEPGRLLFHTLPVDELLLHDLVRTTTDRRTRTLDHCPMNWDHTDYNTNECFTDYLYSTTYFHEPLLHDLVHHDL